MNKLLLFTSAIVLTTFIFSCSTLMPTKEPSVPVDTIEPEPNDIPESNYAQFEFLTISKGEFRDKITLSWEATPDVEDDLIYHIYRADKMNTPYKKIAETSEASWSDTKATPGLKLFYRVVPVIKGTEDGVEEGEAAETEDAPSTKELVSTPEKEDVDHDNFGYARSTYPSGTSFNALTRTYNWGIPKMTAAQRKQAKSDTEYLKEKVLHPVKLNMTLMMITPHLNSGKVVALTNFKAVSVVRRKRMIYLFDKDYSYVVAFTSSHVSRILSSRTRKSLYERLMFNSVAFGAKDEEIEVIDDKGYTRILPSFKSIALATQYYPKTRNWKNETILFVTGDKELQREMRKVQDRNNR
ncbi:MAG: hypothetical protein PF637_11420 [Spirochaetes bacterium]|jgi:hypothetical protein|nr:hypothetical protein [Spirochaetota bacterium]